MNLRRVPGSAHNSVFDGKRLYHLAGLPPSRWRHHPKGTGAVGGKNSSRVGKKPRWHRLREKKIFVSVSVGSCYKSHHVKSPLVSTPCCKTFTALTGLPRRSRLIHGGGL